MFHLIYKVMYKVNHSSVLFEKSSIQSLPKTHITMSIGIVVQSKNIERYDAERGFFFQIIIQSISKRRRELILGISKFELDLTLHRGLTFNFNYFRNFLIRQNLQ